MLHVTVLFLATTEFWIVEHFLNVDVGRGVRRFRSATLREIRGRVPEVHLSRLQVEEIVDDRLPVELVLYLRRVLHDLFQQLCIRTKFFLEARRSAALCPVKVRPRQRLLLLKLWLTRYLLQWRFSLEILRVF